MESQVTVSPVSKTSIPGDTIVLSPTRIRRWVRCRKSYFWRYHRKLVRLHKEVPPTLGLVVGEALAGYYRIGDYRDQDLLDKSLEASLASNRPKFLEEVSDEKREKEWIKTQKLSGVLLSQYHNWAFLKDNFRVLEVERPHQISLSPAVSLLAIPDTIVALEEVPLILEHKVRYRYRPGDFGIDYQSVGSCLVSGAIGTLYNILEYSRPKFHREPIMRSEYELNYFKSMFIFLGMDILNTPPEEMYPQPFKRCQCEYWELCQAEQSGLDIEDVIKELYMSSGPREPAKGGEKGEDE